MVQGNSERKHAGNSDHYLRATQRHKVSEVRKNGIKRVSNHWNNDKEIVPLRTPNSVPKSHPTGHKARNTRTYYSRRQKINGERGIWTRYGFWPGGHASRRPFDSLASRIIGK